MTSLIVILPELPPSTNKLYSRNWDKSLRLSDAAKSWIGQVTDKTNDAAKLAGVHLAPHTRWRLEVTAWVPRWNRDLDNMLKHTIDGICAALGINDRYLVELTARRESGGPAMTLRIVALDEGSK